ncbi:hypothetical protein NGRA_2432, partial [Nosema granulosis]
MVIEHVRGKENPSDCLSRLAVYEVRETEEEVKNREAELIKNVHERLAHGSSKSMACQLRNKNIKNYKHKVEEKIQKCLTCQRMGIGYKRRNIIAVPRGCAPSFEEKKYKQTLNNLKNSYLIDFSC